MILQRMQETPWTDYFLTGLLERIRFLAIGHHGETECFFRRKPGIWILWCKWFSSHQLRRAVAPDGKQAFYGVHPAFLTDRTDVNIDTADSEELFPPGLPLFFFCYFFYTEHLMT